MEAIKEKLDLLIILQEKDRVLDKFRSRAREIPLKIEEHGTTINGLRTQLDESKKNVISFQLEKKQKELDLESHEAQIKKRTAELNSVKSNDTYKALLAEIETAKKANSQLENDILEIMEKIDAENIAAREKEKELKLKESAIQSDIKCLEDDLAKLNAEISKLETERSEYSKGIPSDVLKRYDWIRESREGVAVVAIEGENCCGCNMQLRPQVVNDVIKGQDFVTCDSCSRILYKK
jgi:predicted  nucleic acid-binding Zn-ribbon protein